MRESVGERENRQKIGDTAKRRHLITKQDVANLRRKVCDRTLMKHSDDAASVNMMEKPLLKIVGDGNCFFRAMVSLFYGSQEKHADVRNEIVGHIGKLQTSFLHSCPSQQRRYNNTYYIQGTQVCGPLAEIMAAVELYGVPLYLYTLTPSRTSYHWQCYSPEQPEGHEVRQTPHGHIEVAHPMAIHFDVILDGNTGLPSLTPPQLTGKTSIHPDIL